jgi:cob(I)alamin adenosyltransferase
MIHLYFGEGKGKTTAACGLAIRAAGSGMKILFTQFFKNGKSSEVAVLSKVENIDCRFPSVNYGRYKNMTEEQKNEEKNVYGKLFAEIIGSACDYDMIVLDESVSALNYGFLPEDALMEFLLKEGKNREIILTGRNPSARLLEIADYATEMRKEKHPFDKGIRARKGIEF